MTHFTWLDYSLSPDPSVRVTLFVINELPAGLPGLLIAAIYSGTMSATSSGINALTTATLVDFRQQLSRKPPASEANQLRLARYHRVSDSPVGGVGILVSQSAACSLPR